MDFNKLFNMQKELDEKIETQHNITTSKLNERFLAFLVELGELANETRCFKYWSVKPPSEKEVILEEYVDGIHFLLSIGLKLDYTDIDITKYLEETILFSKLDAKKSISDKYITPILINVYDAAIQFFNSNKFFASDEKGKESKELFETLFCKYLFLGTCLGFTFKEIEEFYIKKNEINHKRQDNNY